MLLLLPGESYLGHIAMKRKITVIEGVCDAELLVCGDCSECSSLWPFMSTYHRIKYDVHFAESKFVWKEQKVFV